MKIKKMSFSLLFLFFLKCSSCFAQACYIDSCNLSRFNGCDERRWKDVRDKPKHVNHKKMLRIDKKVMIFLNSFHTDFLSFETFYTELQKMKYANVINETTKDTTYFEAQLMEKG